MRHVLIGAGCVLTALYAPAHGQDGTNTGNTAVVSTVESETDLAKADAAKAKWAEERAAACRDGTAGKRFICFPAVGPINAEQSSEAGQSKTGQSKTGQFKDAPSSNGNRTFDLGSVGPKPVAIVFPITGKSRSDALTESCRAEKAERIAAGQSPEGPRCRELAEYQRGSSQYPGLQPAAPKPAETEPKSQCVTNADGSTTCSGSVSKVWGSSEEAKRRAEQALNDALKDD